MLLLLRAGADAGTPMKSPLRSVERSMVFRSLDDVIRFRPRLWGAERPGSGRYRLHPEFANRRMLLEIVR